MPVGPLIRFLINGIGLMVGAGIYATIGDLVRKLQEHATTAFALASVLMVLNAYVFGCIASALGPRDNVMSYVTRACGKRVAVAFELLRLVEGGMALCVTASLSVRFLLSWTGWEFAESPVLIFCALMLVSALLTRGLDGMIDLGNIGTLIEVGGLVLIVCLSVCYHSVLGYPIASSSDSPPPPAAGHVWMKAISEIIFAFGGVQGLLDLVNDVPGAHDLFPRVFTAAAFITGVLYTSVSWAAIRLVGVAAMSSKSVSPLGHALELVGFPFGTAATLQFVSFVSVTNTCLTIFAFVSRISLSMFLGLTNRPHPKPVERQRLLSIIYVLMSVAASMVCAFADVFELADAVGVLLLVTFIVLIVCFLRLQANSVREKLIGGAALVSSLGVVVAHLVL